MSGCHLLSLVSSLLVAASLQAVQGLDLRRGLPSTLEWSQEKAFFASGVLWNIYQETSDSSPISEVIPRNVHCKKEGLNPVAGSCHKFIYCKDLSGEGVDDWYILLFTCPEGQVFEDASGKCRHLSSVKWQRPECHSDRGSHVSGDALIHNRFLDVDDLTKEDALTTSNSTSEKTHPGTLRDSSKQDDEDCDDDDTSVACDVPGKEELNKNGTEVSANVHQETESLPLGITRQNNEVVRDDTADRDDVQERKKRFANFLETKKNIADIIALEAVEVCNNMKNINEYVTYVRSRRPVQLPHKELFLVDILNTHNQYLKSAQTNTQSWDQRKGILEAITEVFDLAREFGPKLKTRFLNMKTSIASLPKMDQNFVNMEIDINRLKEEVKRLEAEVKRLEAQIKSIPHTDGINIFVGYLEQVLKEKKLELRNLVRKREDNGKEFQQLTEILEYVLNNSIEIQGKSSNAVRLMEAFHQNIHQDCGKFNHSISKALMGQRATEAIKEKTQKEIIDHKKRMEAAKGEMEEKRKLIQTYGEQLEKTKIDIKQEMEALESNAGKYHDMAIAGGVLMIWPVWGWIAGGVLLGVGIEEQKKALRRKEEARAHLESEIKIHREVVAVLGDIVATEKQVINKLVSTIRTFESRLLTLQEINGVLQRMERSATSLMPFITRAVSVLAGLNDVFSSVEDDLIQMKQEASEAHTKAMQGEDSYFKYEGIREKVEGAWEDAKSKIISVGDCVPRN